MDKAILKELGKNLKYYRCKTKLTQEETGVRVEKTANYISKLECGQAWPSMKLLYQLAIIYNCSVLTFLPPTNVQEETEDVLKSLSILSAADRNQQKFIFEFLEWYTNRNKGN